MALPKHESMDFNGLEIECAELTVAGSINANDIQSNGTTEVTATASSFPTLSFTGGLHLVSNTSSVNEIVLIPTDTASDYGKKIRLYAVEGFEIRSGDASATINGTVVGATNELAIAAGDYVELICVADNTWLALGTDEDGSALTLTPNAV